MKSRQEIEKISRQKRKVRLLLILLCVTVAVLAAAIILVNVIPEEEETPTTQKPNLPEIIEGEALENNYALAYPSIADRYITSIKVTNKASYANDFNEGEAPYTSYTLLRHEIAGGNFVLRYEDKEGNEKIYLPDIFSADPSFEYDSLYALETGDGYGQIHKLTYLLVALELPYFTDRIALEADADKRDSQLRGFGLDEPQATIQFYYTDKNDNTSKLRTIKIGDKNVTGVGYYFMVDDRPYIYNSLADYYNYAMLGFYSYVNSILVSAGLAEDSSYEPYLTTDYKQWLNSVTMTEGTQVPAGSTAIIYTDIFTPIESKLDRNDYEKDTLRFDLDDDLKLRDPEAYLSGYIKDGYHEYTLDLSQKGAYDKLAKLIAGKTIGDFDSDTVVTITASKTIDFADKSSLKYRYEVIEIESIVTDGADIITEGHAIDADDKIKIAYYLYVDGKKVSNVPYHGVIDLASGKFDDLSVAALTALTVGKLDTDSRVNLEIDYTKENCTAINRTFVIDEIVLIRDEKGKDIDTVAQNCQVLFRFYYYVNGEKQGYDTSYIDFKSDTDESSLEVFEKIKGLSVSKNLNLTLYTQTNYCEFAEEFLTFKVNAVKYFVTSELISAFRFQNNSERDPFYGESIYENTMDNEYSLYAINSSTCEAVAKMLGGITDTTGSSFGFIGSETVAVGITPKVMRDYGLYAHTIYFELPRGIIVKDSGDDDTVDDYDQYNKLGFTLYISDEVYDAKSGAYIRYVGSDLYDIVAKVDAEDLVFLKYNFVDFWARRSLMMFDIKYLADMDVEFNMQDLKGSYTFDIPAASKSDTTFVVRLANSCPHDTAQECDCTSNKALDYIRNYNLNHPDNPIQLVTLTQLYNDFMERDGDEYYSKDGKVLLYGENSYDSAGVGNFRELMGILYSIPYSGKLDKAEQEAAVEDGYVMKISLKLDTGTEKNTSENRHVYEFYRCGDRQVMVRMYEAKEVLVKDDSGKVVTDKYGKPVTEEIKVTDAVSDFYISTLAFKKIVSSYFALLNAEMIYPDQAYPGLSN